MDILIEYLQQEQDQTGVYVKYGTLSEYYDALWAENITYFTERYNDYFPLDEGDYWTVFSSMGSVALFSIYYRDIILLEHS